MSKVLARVVPASDRPRGPDAVLELPVPEDWLSAGATVEIELPRNLVCAVCEGGGCDTCGRSGAVTLRGRGEPAELVEVTLPRPDAPSTAGRGIVLRVSERGGLPPADAELPRGNLLLSVRVGEPRQGVARVRRTIAPPAAERPGSLVPPGSLRLLGYVAALVLVVAIILILQWMSR